VIKTFPASLDSLYEMLAFIRVQAIAADFHPSCISQIELAAEEALVNIVSYGYPTSSGNIEIECQVKNEDFRALQIIIRDQGVPYDPLSSFVERKEIPAIEKRKPGGYGVFFILKIMDEVHYKREGDTNVLILVKYL